MNTQLTEDPSMKNPQLESTDATSGYNLTPPHGLDEIIATFGNIYEYIGTGGQLAPRWQSDFLAKTSLPFPMRLAWDPSRVITQMTCHRLMTGIYASVFAGIQKNWLESKVMSFGGCFRFSSPTHRKQTLRSQLGHRDRSQSANRCAGVRREHGCPPG